MLSSKEKKLVQHLLKHKEDFTTSKTLAQLLSCSDRTIRTYIRTIEEELSSYPGTAIICRQGKGYQLRVTNQESLHRLNQDFGQTESLLVGSEVSDVNDRHSYILNKLLLEQQDLLFDDLAEELFVSRSTLSSDFKKIRQDLAAYDLSIESKANKGVYVVGEEQRIRRFIMVYFFKNEFFQTLSHYVDDDLVYGKINFEVLTVIVLDECREAGLKLSDFVIQNLVVHIALGIRRLAEGYQLSAIDKGLAESHPKEFSVASRIMSRISLATKLDFPEAEIAYITLHLIAKGQTTDDNQDNTSQLRQEVVAVLTDSTFQDSIPLSQDFQFLEGLLTHLMTLYLRCRSGIVLDNPLLEDIKANDARAFQLAQLLLKHLPTFAGYDLSDDETAYVALHIMAAQERYKEQFKFNVLVICATGYGSAQMLRSRIENELRQYVTIVDVIGYYDIQADKLKGVDFILSSIDLSHLIFNIPVFTTSVFLKEDELREIRERIESLAQTRRQLGIDPKPVQSKNDLSELFDRFFSIDNFYIERSGGANKLDILHKLAGRLARDEKDGFSDRLLEMMFQRERLSSVLFSKTIAVPHPIKAVSSKLKIAVAILPQGVDWQENNARVNLIFLPSLSQAGNDGLEVITKAIVDLVDRPDLQDQFRQVQSFDAFRELFVTKLGGKI